MTRREPGSALLSGDAEGVRIQLLGGFRVTVGERIIEESEWRLRKAASLLKLLALSPKHQLHRERVLELLWPDLEPAAAANNLHRTLHALRRILAPDRQSTWLRLQDDILTLGSSGQLSVDVQAFEAAYSAARRTRDPAPYYTALELYTGELLPADRYEDWAASRREHLHDMYLGLLLELARLHEARQELPAAIEALRRVVESEPSHEEAHTSLMRLYALSGQRHQALRQYAQLRDALRRELDAEPEADSEQLYQEIRSGVFPPRASQYPAAPVVQTGPAPRHNLPAPLTSFVGREQEVAEVGRLLATTRLLTLIGTGGCGKTRLALEVARGSVAAYADGVWLVELAGLSDPGLVPRTVAGALGVREDPDRPLIDVLTDALRSRRMLLVLDNCEHLLDACAHLAETLLSSCPDLRVLATSRESLGAGGELHRRVPSLSVPSETSPPPVERLTEYGSVRLFVERARFRQPALELTRGNAPAVLDICRRLEGIPLAIELAAARASALPPEQIAARLGNSLGLLTGGGRLTAPRHKTLRGVFDWSYELLGEAERGLFARLSVFAGGWDLSAAEAVGAVGERERAEILDLLSHLVDKSLVLAEPGGSGTVRYRLLEPVRQYAREKLEERGEADDTSLRHATFFLALAEQAEPELTGHQQTEWLQRLETEHDNLRAALSWTLEHNEPELAARLAGALWRFWYTRGHVTEGRRWLERALSDPEAVWVSARAKALRGAGVLAYAQADGEQAVSSLEESVTVYREIEDKQGLAGALGNLGVVVTVRGDYERARALHEESLVLSRGIGSRGGIALSVSNLGEVAYYQGDYEAAKAYWEEALHLGREARNLSFGVTLNNLGGVVTILGDYERAAAVYEEAVALFRELGAKYGLAPSLQNLARLRLWRRDYEQAATLLRESIGIARETGDQATTAYCLERFAELAAAEERFDRAARLFGAADALREASGLPLSTADVASLEPVLDAARAQLDESTWERVWTAGRDMPLEQAIEYALSSPEPASPPTPPQPAADGKVASLTPREREIVGLIAQGLTNRQIAQQLVLSERTVDTHGVNIMRKLGLRTRAQVAAWAAQQGLLTGR